MQDKTKIYAFTITEVLITIGIIGIVAAMTLPALINNAQNKALESKLKKSYALIAQTIQLIIENEYGGVTELSQSDYYEIGNYLKKYVGNSRNVGDVRWGTSYSANFMIEKYKTYTNNTFSGMFNDYAFYTSDNNATVFLDTGHSPSLPNLFIAIDINNIDNKPNKLGFDLFGFYLDKKGILLPFGDLGSPYPEGRYCTGTSTDRNNGLGCTRKALIDPKYFTKLH